MAVSIALAAAGLALQVPTAQAQPAKPADPIAPLPESATSQDAVPTVEVPPPLVWQADQVKTLLAYIEGVGHEGLTPADYDPDGLTQALLSNDVVAMSAAATDRFNRLSSDLALGHVRDDSRVDWHVVDRDLDKDRQRQLLTWALATNQIDKALNDLLPTHPQYAALRHALEVTPPEETDKINRIRLNMDRWRWLPHDLGDKYIIVNVPSYYATLVENGETRWKRRAVAGAIRTPTPQLNAMATGVILNPWWEVPTSISKEVAGKAGFVAVKDKDGKVQRWRQPPGPSNALGQLKFVMPNEFAIYLHDTNARSRFNNEVRALSHGCIRTQQVVDLATKLLSDDGGEWDAQKVADTLASKKTVQANFVKPVPVYIVYFSSAALNDGSIVDYEDVYKRDGTVIAALLNSSGETTDKAAPKVASK